MKYNLKKNNNINKIHFTFLNVYIWREKKTMFFESKISTFKKVVYRILTISLLKRHFKELFFHSSASNNCKIYLFLHYLIS